MPCLGLEELWYVKSHGHDDDRYDILGHPAPHTGGQGGVPVVEGVAHGGVPAQI